MRDERMSTVLDPLWLRLIIVIQLLAFEAVLLRMRVHGLVYVEYIFLLPEKKCTL